LRRAILLALELLVQVLGEVLELPDLLGPGRSCTCLIFNRGYPQGCRSDVVAADPIDISGEDQLCSSCTCSSCRTH
jgi:hypothetical protein